MTNTIHLQVSGTAQTSASNKVRRLVIATSGLLSKGFWLDVTSKTLDENTLNIALIVKTGSKKHSTKKNTSEREAAEAKRLKTSLQDPDGFDLNTADRKKVLKLSNMEAKIISSKGQTATLIQKPKIVKLERPQRCALALAHGTEQAVVRFYFDPEKGSFEFYDVNQSRPEHHATNPSLAALLPDRITIERGPKGTTTPTQPLSELGKKLVAFFSDPNS